MTANQGHWFFASSHLNCATISACSIAYKSDYCEREKKKTRLSCSHSNGPLLFLSLSFFSLSESPVSKEPYGHLQTIEIRGDSNTKILSGTSIPPQEGGNIGPRPLSKHEKDFFFKVHHFMRRASFSFLVPSKVSKLIKEEEEDSIVGGVMSLGFGRGFISRGE